jgi:Ca-activated chloride channel family protein
MKPKTNYKLALISVMSLLLAAPPPDMVAAKLNSFPHAKQSNLNITAKPSQANDPSFSQANVSAAGPEGSTSTILKTGAESTSLNGSTQESLIHGNIERQAGPINILFVLDASYSMKDKLGGHEKKINAAKQVLENALSRIPAGVNLGLRVFGQAYTGIPDLDCRQTALLVPVGQGNRRSIIEKVRRIEPYGMTPLEYALRQAAESDLRNLPGTKTIILITDGAETCGGDPCRYIQTLPSRGIKLKVDVVGLNLRRDPQAKSQLNCITEASGGKYYDANTAADLIEGISKSVNKAISGKVITHPNQGTKNSETQEELEPNLPEK